MFNLTDLQDNLRLNFTGLDVSISDHEIHVKDMTKPRGFYGIIKIDKNSYTLEIFSIVSETKVVLKFNTLHELREEIAKRSS